MEKGRKYGKGFLNTSINQWEGNQKYAMGHIRRILFVRYIFVRYTSNCTVQKKFKHLYWCTNSI